MIINLMPHHSRPIAKRPPLRAPEFTPVDMAERWKRFRRLAENGKKNG